MSDKREFKIDLHADDPDEVAETIDPVTEPSNPSPKAWMLFGISALVVFGGLLVFLYYNLNNKIQTINTRGSAGIANLSQELNDKLGEFSLQISTQQETTRTIVADIDTRLKAVSALISAIKSDKLDKKELADITKKLQNEISPLHKSVTELKEQLIRINEETLQIAENQKKIQTGVLNNKKEISTLDAIHVDREYFDKELQKEREFNQQNMAHASETLFSEIATLHQLIKDLENKIDRINAASQIQSSPGKQSNETKLPSEKLSIPKPGEIIEQELK